MASMFALVLDLYALDLAFVYIKCDEWEIPAFCS
jgi:hypothetical protein